MIAKIMLLFIAILFIVGNMSLIIDSLYSSNYSEDNSEKLQNNNYNINEYDDSCDDYLA